MCCVAEGGNPKPHGLHNFNVCRYTYMDYQILISVVFFHSFFLFGAFIHSKIEPARFDSPMKNVSSRRNDPVALSCLGKGDDHINIIWFHNNARINLHNYRYNNLFCKLTPNGYEIINNKYFCSNYIEHAIRIQINCIY